MINIIKQEIPIDESLKKKLEFICDFCNTTPTFINGSIRKIDKTNLWYLANKLELLNDEDFKTKTYHDDKDIDIEAIKNSEKMFEDVEISSSAANGGG